MAYGPIALRGEIYKSFEYRSPILVAYSFLKLFCSKIQNLLFPWNKFRKTSSIPLPTISLLFL